MRKQLIILIVVVAGALVASCMARAAGESKNQAPFTTLVTSEQSQIQGEAKNLAPFTRLVDGEQGQGEAKNQLPFTARPTVVPEADRALAIRSQAMNRRYNTAALSALQVRSEALDQKYGQGVQTAVPDVFERYAAAHPYGSGLATTVAVSKSDGGIDWGYVGGGVAIGAVLLLMGLVVLQSRRRSHTGAVLGS